MFKSAEQKFNRLPKTQQDRQELKEAIRRLIKRMKKQDQPDQQSLQILHTRLKLIDACSSMSLQRLDHLQEIFKHYCTHIFRTGRYMTFDRLQYEKVHLIMERFFLFLKDFDLTTMDVQGKKQDVVQKNNIITIFKTISSTSKDLTFEEFITCLEKIAVIYYDEKSVYFDKKKKKKEEKQKKRKQFEKARMKKLKKRKKRAGEQSENDEGQEQQQGQKEQQQEKEEKQSQKVEEPEKKQIQKDTKKDTKKDAKKDIKIQTVKDEKEQTVKDSKKDTKKDTKKESKKDQKIDTNKDSKKGTKNENKKGKEQEKKKENSMEQQKQEEGNNDLVDDLMNDEDLEDPNEQVNKIKNKYALQSRVQGQQQEEEAEEPNKFEGNSDLLLLLTNQEKIEFYYQIMIRVDNVADYRKRLSDLNLPLFHESNKEKSKTLKRSDNENKIVIKSQSAAQANSNLSIYEGIEELKKKMDEKKFKEKASPIPKPKNDDALVKQEQQRRKRKQVKKERQEQAKKKNKQESDAILQKKIDSQKPVKEKKNDYNEKQLDWSSIGRLSIQQLKLKQFNPNKFYSKDEDDKIFLDEYETGGGRKKVNSSFRQRQSMSIVEDMKKRVNQIHEKEKRQDKQLENLSKKLGQNIPVRNRF